MFFAADAFYLVFVSVKLQDFNPLIRRKMESNFEKFSTISGLVNLVFFIPFLICITLYYCWMRRNLKLYCSDKMQTQQRQISILFAVLIGVYVFRMVTSLGFGHYEKIIC